jgi:hypothetical protein
VFLNDIVVYARSVAEYDTKLGDIFDRNRENSLKLKREKSEFLRKEVSCLGHMKSKMGLPGMVKDEGNGRVSNPSEREAT